MSELEEKKLKIVLTNAYHDYHSSLFRYACYKISDTGVVLDLVQNTFIKSWNYLRRGGKIRKMKAFLYHVLNNLIIDEYRKKKTSSLDQLLEKGFEPGKDYSPALINKLDGRGAIKLVRRLPPKYRSVVYMRYVEDLSLEEIKERTNLNKNTIAVEIYRGIKKLKNIYPLNS
jgi:RNA polymerase sigma-70 factor (ECF subfamily)